MSIITLNHWEQTGLETSEGKYKRDLLLMRHLGIPARFEKASIHHPDFKQTEVMHFLTRHFEPSSKKCVMLIGAPGTGKTYGAVAYFVNQLPAYIEQDVVKNTPGIFVSAYDLAEKLFRKEYAFLDRCKKTKALFIDDLGTEPEGFKGQDFQAHFQMLFNHRYENNALTILTSNFTPESMKAHYGERLTSRLSQFGMVFETKDPDFRRASA